MSEDSRPLLTIAIPTYNRAVYLRELLEQLLPQVAELGAEGRGQEIELIISDNAATDETPSVTAWAQSTGVSMRVLRQMENVGPDRNFSLCFNEAQGKYFWLFGDDDILRPGGLNVILDSLRGAEFDLAFLAPQVFYSDWREEWEPDPFGRTAQTIRSARHFTRIINVGVTFVTGLIVNRDRVLELGAEPPENFLDTFLVQLSWMLPNLRKHRQSVVLWQRVVSGRAMNSGGYDVADIFGAQFFKVVNRILPDRPELGHIFANFALRRWFPATLVELRERSEKNEHTGVATTDSERKLRELFHGNVRFWLFTWPVLRLALPMAQRYLRFLNVINKGIDWVLQPGDTIDKFRRRLNRPDPQPIGAKR
jgi:abequosyltransferase